MTQDVANYWSPAAVAEKIEWEAVFRRDFPRIYNYLRYRLGEETLAEELAAETFAKAWRNRDQYRADLAAFSTWLFTIARNLATDQSRRQRHEVPLEKNHTPMEERAGPSTVERVIQDKEETAHLLALLSQLPEREREIIALKYGADMNHREIARVLDLSVVNVGVIVYRTVRKLRARWEMSE
jgi:RNA polymerase sigma-70 factor (ECF subfamily)